MEIRIHTAGKLPMEDLWKIALKYCYDQKNISHFEEQQMRESCFLWNKHVCYLKEDRNQKFGLDMDMRPVGTRGTWIDEIEFYLGIICYHIEACDNSKPWMVTRRATYKAHGIDYRKAYKLQGATTKLDFVKAMKYLKKAMHDNPQDYQ